MARIGWDVLGSVLIAYAALHVLGRRAGSTAEERRLRMLGDELVPHPHILTNHAITIEVRSADVLALAYADGLAPGRLLHARMG
jgi:hypothetical protein